MNFRTHSPAIVEELRRMAAFGLSYTDAGKILRRSRNVVCGLAKRNNIEFHCFSRPYGSEERIAAYKQSLREAA